VTAVWLARIREITNVTADPARNAVKSTSGSGPCHSVVGENRTVTASGFRCSR